MVRLWSLFVEEERGGVVMMMRKFFGEIFRGEIRIGISSGSSTAALMYVQVRVFVQIVS